MRDIHEIQVESNIGGWQNADACAIGTMGYGMSGPLPRSKHGKQMQLVLIDRFSKWTELVPQQSATAESLKKAFRERIIARYGIPKVVIADNGVQFARRIFKSFLAEMGTKQQLTAPYTPQENPTEPANRMVKTMIALFARQDQRNWEEKLPEIMLAVNASVLESTGYTPSFIRQCREPRLPSTLYDRETLGTGRTTETPDESANKLREIFENVRRYLERALG